MPRASRLSRLGSYIWNKHFSDLQPSDNPLEQGSTLLGSSITHGSSAALRPADMLRSNHQAQEAHFSALGLCSIDEAQVTHSFTDTRFQELALLKYSTTVSPLEIIEIR